MKFYFVAGERSGDLHAGNLIKAILKGEPSAQFRGFGGDGMQQAGMDLVVHYRELAFMGFAEVIANLSTISKKLKQCQQDLIQYKPDAVVLVDYAGFNLRIAKFAKAHQIKVLWYISPKVWAWNQGRAWKLKKYIDRMFVILPFEKEFFKRFDWDVDYVGNPVLDAVKAHSVNQNFLSENNLSETSNLVALLPGSRKQEVVRIIPVMAEVAKQRQDVSFVVAKVDNLPDEVYAPLKDLSNVKFTVNTTYDLLSFAKVAVVASGTATLETCLFKVPQVVVYRTSMISYTIAKLLVKVPFISLVNLIAGKEIVKELIQHTCRVETVGRELDGLLKNIGYRTQVLEGYKTVMNLLDTGSATENTAKLMIKILDSVNTSGI